MSKFVKVGAIQHPLLAQIIQDEEVSSVSDISPSLARYECLIIDASTHFSALQLYIGILLEAKTAILLFNISAEQQQQLAEHIGFFTPGSSVSLLISLNRDAYGRPHYHLVDYPDPNDPVFQFTATRSEVVSQKIAATASESNSEAKMEDASLTKSEKNAEENFVQLVSDALLNRQQYIISTDIPDGLKMVQYSLSQTISFPLGASEKHGGDQTSSITYAWVWSVYYNDYGAEYFQYILVQSSATVSTGGLAYNGEKEKGWSQSQFNLSIQPQNSQITWVQSSPETVNGQTDVTDSTSFTVNFDLDNNPNVGGSYTVDHSETRTIQDWQIIETTTGNKVAWLYGQTTPYDGLNENNLDDRFKWDGYPKDLPALSLYTLQSHTQAVWKTPSPMEGYAAFDFSTGTAYVDSWGSDCSPGICWTINTYPAWKWQLVNPNYFNINIGAVIDSSANSLISQRIFDDQTLTDNFSEEDIDELEKLGVMAKKQGGSDRKAKHTSQLSSISLEESLLESESLAKKQGGSDRKSKHE